MTKKELLAAIPDAEEMGLTVAPLALLDIFEEDEQIPEEFVRLFLRVPEEPKPYTVLMGAEMMEKLNEALYKHIQSLNIISDKDRTKLLAVMQKWEHQN